MESNRVLVLQDIVAALSAETGTSEALCRSFVDEMFALVSDRLIGGESVEIGGVGKFDVEDGRLQFAADADVAAAINSAFDCFEAIELADDFDGDEPQEEEAVADEAEEPQEPATAVAEGPAAEPHVDDAMADDEPVEESQDEEKESESEPMADNDASQELPMEQESDDVEEECDSDQPLPRRSRRFAWGFVSGFMTAAVIAVAIAVYLYFTGLPSAAVDSAAEMVKTDSTTAVTDTTVAAADTVKTVETPAAPKTDEKVEPKEPAAKEQMFKVTNTAYLSNISRKYYGHYAFWVYIYLENKDVIKDPDNLPVGAELRIPAPEKYGIDKNDPESVRRAEIKALEVKNGK